MRIFLTGFMGCGKTTIGRRLCEPIGFDFIDTDRYIEEKHKATISDIFASLGEQEFRQMEHQILKEIVAQDYIVVSTGGGMPCYMNNMDIMLANGKVVYLKTDPQTLAGRLTASKTERPLIRNKTSGELLQYIHDKLKEREQIYRRAHFTVQTENFSMNRLLQSLELMKPGSIHETNFSAG
jgi:shikimate kinase